MIYRLVLVARRGTSILSETSPPASMFKIALNL